MHEERDIVLAIPSVSQSVCLSVNVGIEYERIDVSSYRRTNGQKL